jgi:hypothetical protein
LEKVFISLVKDPNVQFVTVRKDFFALAMICPFSPPSKSHFVQLNVVCPAPAVPAVPTFWTPGGGAKYFLSVMTIHLIA